MAHECLVVAQVRGIARLRPAIVAFTVMLAWFAAPSAACAANHALLIGVSNYTYKEITPLKGPGNDVTLMWRALGKRGFSNMTVLADGLPAGPAFPTSAGEPTRANILAAFTALAGRAKAGDLVLIYYSGHGTEQPVRNVDQDSERGNLDQVMLPIDAGGYDRETQTVTNGIVDDAIGAALDRIRAQGADVWVIFDSCHAGSMTRGVFDGLAVRGIESSRLGIPPTPPGGATRGCCGWSSR
ncbi:MAG: caspase domain-containing protein, partial [Pseudolabrys sp.]